jgi:hypothetical protein
VSHERAAPMIVTETTSRALEVRRERRPLEARESIKPSRFCLLECKAAAQIKQRERLLCGNCALCLPAAPAVLNLKQNGQEI